MVKVIKFFLFDDLNYRINYSSEAVDNKISSAILNLFLSYFVKGINTGILYKKIENKFLIMKVDSEEDDNEYTIKFVYLENLSEYPIKLMYEKGFIDSKFKHKDYEDLEFESLSKYMKSIDAHGFREVVSALFKAKYYNCAIRIRGNIKELLIWVAAIQTIFPREFSDSISFKIEQYKNEIGMASISICENLVDVRYRLSLDKETESIEKYRFTSMIEMQYLMPSNNLKEFFLFVTYFDYKVLDERLEDIYNIYMISRLGIGDVDYTAVRLAFDTLNEIGSSEAKRVVILNMLKVIDTFTGDMDLKLFRLIMEFAFKASNEMESLFINQMCKEFYVKALVSIIFENKYKDIETLENTISEIENFTEKNELYRYLLDDKRLENIKFCLSINVDSEKALFILKNLLHYNMELGYKWNKFSETLMDIIDSCVKSIANKDLDLSELLSNIMVDEEFATNIIIKIYNLIEVESVQHKFINEIVDTLNLMEDEKALDIRKRLANTETGVIILYNEFKMLMEKEKYTCDSFKEYISSFYNSKEYFKKCFARAVSNFLANSKDMEAYNFSIFIINEILDKQFKLSVLPDKAMVDLVLNIEKYVDFSNCEEVYNILDLLEDIKKDRNIKTSIDITRLLKLQRLIENNERINIFDYSFKDVFPSRLSDYSYEKYSELNLEKIISLCSDKEEHKIVIKAFMKDNNFIFKYLDIALNEENIKNDVGLSYIIYYLYYIHPVYKMEEKEELLLNIREIIIEKISKLSFSDVCEVDNKVKKYFEDENLSMPKEWEDIFTSIKKRKSDGNFMDKIKFMMKK